MPRCITKKVRLLRKQSTNAENIFWYEVRNRKIDGYKFVRQQPLRFTLEGRKLCFVADFYCSEKKLIVEIDGPIHRKQKDYDKIRSQILKLGKYRIIRFTNDEVEYKLADVIKQLKHELEK